jgi:predicted ATPase/class 3 adenylate cyclase
MTAKAVVHLFTDIEGSTSLWEREPGRMDAALRAHDAMLKAAVGGRRGRVVKSTGDGIHAVFDDAADAVAAALQMQLALANPAATAGLELRLRCGLHAGTDEYRDGDFYGQAVNRAARIMSVAHGGQTVLSQAIIDGVGERMPRGATWRDLGHVRLRDLKSPERVYQLAHPQLRAQFPPLRSLEATPNNLPQQLNSFVGRERELAEAKARLADNRLVTLLGMGGIGKSRLSIQLGADLLDDYRDGVWLVELAPLTDPRLVPQAVASVLGVKEAAGHSVQEALLRYVRDKQVLFILDNCEHVVQACAELAKQLMQAGAGIKVLASSRDVLQVAGEATYQVPTLSVPDPHENAEPAQLLRHEAVRLFVDRAHASQPSFEVTPGNAAAVADICNRLDGIPLALELAAARTRALSVEAIAARLDDRFRLLVSGDQTVLPRQRTLRALIDWSHDLLPDEERTLFRRLAVFAGGFALEAAEQVGGGDGLDAADVLDLLAHLVEKSLVIMEAGGQRYRMLDTVRHYAQERLDESADKAGAQARHFAHYLQVAEQARAGLVGAEQAAWLTRLDQERENLLAAHGRCDGADSSACEMGLRLVYALRPYWLNRGLLALGFRITVEALDREGAQKNDQLRYSGLWNAGYLAYFMGRYAQSRAYLQESLGIAREMGNAQSAALVLYPLGMAYQGEGDVVAAQAHLEEAVALDRELGNQRELVAASNALAQLHRMQGRHEEAEPLYESALVLARELGDREYTAGILLNLAMASVGRGFVGRTSSLLKEALGIANEIGSKPALQSAVEVCAGLAASQADWQRSARLFGAAQALAAQTGLQRDPADEAFLMPLMALARDALGRSMFETFQTQGCALTLDDALTQARMSLCNETDPIDGSTAHQ